MMSEASSSWDVFRQRSELEKSRRSLSETLSRLEALSQQGSSSFSPEMEHLRMRLAEASRKLLELDPGDWGLKALEFYWAKGLHAPLKRAMNKEASLSVEERTRVQALLWRAVSHFRGVLDGSMGGHNGGHMGGTLSFAYSEYEQQTRTASRGDGSSSSKSKSTLWVKCLLYLGDLMRYCREICPTKSPHYWDISRGYYVQALNVSDFKAGMPYNQLGRLSENELWGLTSAYYYLRSTLSDESFPGSEVNLKNLLSKSVKSYSSKAITESNANMEAFVHEILHLSATSLLQNESVESNVEELICDYFQSALGHFYAQIVRDPSAEDGHVAMVAVAYLLASLQFLTERRSDKQRLVIAYYRAALLALFSHCALKLLSDLQRELFGDEEVDVDIPEERKVSPEMSKSRNILDRFRRRRTRYASSDEASDEEESYTNSTSSSDIENGDITSSCLSDSDDSDDESGSDVIIKQSSSACSSKDLAKTLGSHPLVPAIRLLSLWVMVTPAVIKEGGDEHSDLFWVRLESLFHTVDFTNKSATKITHQSDEVNALWASMDGQTTPPLGEDVFIRGLLDTQQLDSSREMPGEPLQRGLIRVKQLLGFRDWLHELKSRKGSSMVDGLMKKEKPPVNSEESKRNALMQNMAQLWLRQEVEDLEEKKKTISPFIIVDHYAMVKHLRNIRDILAAKKFTVIIPNAVVQELDSMKRDNKVARVAIRWLESQFKQGNPWLRSQKNYECTPLEDVTYPKKKNTEASHYFEILECCNYFTRMGSTRTVTLLSSQDFEMDLDPLELAKCIGIRIEHVKAFRHCLKRSNAKERNVVNG